MRSVLKVFLLAILCGSPATLAAQKLGDALPPEDMRLPKGSKLFISPVEGGYDIYLAAAIVQKKVPVVIVTDKSAADFELSAATETEKAGWAKMLFLGSTNSNEQASIKIVNLKTNTVVFGYNVNKSNSVRGKQSSSEACAKHLKEKIEREEK